MLDAEALLLVDDHEAEVLDLHAGLQQAVRADDQVDRAVGEALEGLLGLLVGLEPRQRPDRHRELAEPLGERRVVLLHQQRRRHEQDDLLAVLDRLERRAYGDLGLAVADVTADQAVHRHGALHVALDLVDRDHLVGRLDERERVLELGLPRGVGAEGVTLGGLARGVELDQLAGDLAYGLAGLVLAVGPVGAAELVERRRLAADVAADLVELVHRHEQPVGGLPALGRRVLDDEVLARRTLHDALHQLDVAADAVLLVHHVSRRCASSSGSTCLRRRDGILRSVRSAARWPTRSSYVMTASCSGGDTKP